MRKQTENSSRPTIIFYSMLLMMATLFVSRAALSISVIVFCLTATVHAQIGSQLKSFFKNRFLFLLSLLCWVPLLSGLWSNDVQQWWNIVQLKLPFVFLPIAFAGSWKLSKPQWQLMGIVFITFVVLACVSSTINYLVDLKNVHESYLRAKLIQTPLENDHVRFSWLVAVTTMLCFLMLHLSPSKFRWLWVALILTFSLYLHLLAARMGLLSLYVFLVIYGAYHVKKHTTRKLYLPLVVIMILLPVLAWLVFPTLKNRINYMQYDLEQVRQNKFLEGSNDGARIFSMAAGWQILKQHPFGVGAGDVPAASNAWFDQHHPEVSSEYRLTPMNEWLMYGAIAGWMGVVIFSIVMIYPFFIHTSQPLFWNSLLTTLILGGMIDMFFEVQYGIFLSAFILLWWYKWFKSAA